MPWSRILSSPDCAGRGRGASDGGSERGKDAVERILAPGSEGMRVTAMTAEWVAVMRWDGMKFDGT